MALELEHRRPVWSALSELFLDASFDAADITRIARTLARSPYTLEELDDILFWEVRPACGSNLRSIAGEWAGFDPDWLESRILRGPSRAGRIWERTVGRIARVFLPIRSWKEIRQRVEADRAVPNGQQP